MKVEWNPRALKRHQHKERVERVKARLTSTPVGDIQLGVPVVHERQIEALKDLAHRFDVIQGQLDVALEQLARGLNLLRGDGHEDGWATVRIVEREGNIIVADVRHHSAQPKAPHEPPNRGTKRSFRAGYTARRR